MEIVVLSQIREEKKKRREQTKRIWRREGYRLIWSSKVFVSWNQYSCYYCIGPIMPGDEYIREVWGNYRHLWVRRRHYPNCNYPTEEEVLEDMERTEREREIEEREAFQESA